MGVRVNAEMEAKILALANQPAPAPAILARAGKAAKRGWAALTVWVPHLPRSEANQGGTRRAAIARKTATKEAVRLELPPTPLDWPRPIRVRLTRCGGKKLDRDNLARSFKAIQDVVAEWLGVDDGDGAAVRWVYRQKPGWAGGVEITVGGRDMC